MIKKTITYRLLDGSEVTEDFFFHYSKTELIDKKLIEGDGLETRVRKIIAEDDKKAILAEFKRIISETVGKASEDGRRFIKNDEIRDAFVQTEAFAQVYMELMTNAGAAAEFIRGVVPSDMTGKVEADPEYQRLALSLGEQAGPEVLKEITAALPSQVPAEPAPAPVIPAQAKPTEKIFGDLTEEEIGEMSPEDFEKFMLKEQTAHQKGFYDFSRTELLGMTDEEFTSLVGDNPRKWDKVQRVVAMQRFANAKKNNR